MKSSSLFPSLATTVLLATATLLQGCAAEAEEDEVLDGQEEQDVAAASKLKATLSSDEVETNVAKCAVMLRKVAGKDQSKAASDAINAALVRSPESLTANLNCRSKETQVASAFLEVYNDRGILSVVEGHTVETTDSAMRKMTPYTFDLRTGAQLKITEVLTPSGLNALTKACTERYTLVEGPTEQCAITADSAFAIEADGITFMQPNVSEEFLDTGLRGQKVKWSALRGKIKHTLIKGVSR